MRIVIDTNLWVSGLLWRGLPWRLLRLAEVGQIELCMSPSILTELSEVLSYNKFQSRMAQLGLSQSELVAYAMSLAFVFEVAQAPPIVLADPDDDIFLHCALAAQAACIVSGDGHLLDLEQYADIPILTVHDFLSREFPDQLA